MKGSLAVMLALALYETPRSKEVTWIFYAREEISRSESGLIELIQLRPDLVHGDVAILAEPTAGAVEAGCQGTLRRARSIWPVAVRTRRDRSRVETPSIESPRSSRGSPSMSRGPSFLTASSSSQEQLQVVFVEGGVAANVVPDVATITLNHRVAPDRSHDEAVAWLRSYLGELIERGDEFTVVDWAPSAQPMLTNERLDALVALTRTAPRGKWGWTDVATFQELEIPATNFGAGDPPARSPERREDHAGMSWNSLNECCAPGCPNSIGRRPRHSSSDAVRRSRVRRWRRHCESNSMGSIVGFSGFRMILDPWEKNRFLTRLLRPPEYPRRRSRQSGPSADAPPR